MTNTTAQTTTYHVGTPEEPAQKNPPITANSAEAAARKYVGIGDWGDAESVTVTVYEDDDGLPDHTRYSDVTVSMTNTAQTTTYRVKTQYVTASERVSDAKYLAIGAEWGLGCDTEDEEVRRLVARDPEAAEDLMEADPAVVRYEAIAGLGGAA